jgi:hypothetical protein
LKSECPERAISAAVRSRRTGERCLVVGIGAESADEGIEREAADLAASRTPSWLVTSDRALRNAAGRDAERTIGGGSFARTLTAAEAPSRAKSLPRGPA